MIEYLIKNSFSGHTKRLRWPHATCGLDTPVVKEVQAARYFSIFCDETKNISTIEQLSVCVCYVDSAWAIEEVFLGLNAAPKCDSETLTTIVKSCLLSLNIPLSNCHGQAYNGAAYRKGNILGVQARIKESNETAM